MKFCTVCNENKPLEDYYNLTKSKDGKSWRCKKCDKETTMESRKKRYMKHRVQARNAQRKFKYNLSEEEFTAIRLKQDNKCASCGELLCDEFTVYHKRNKLVVDHCHTTDKVRGLLCTMCNKGIGLLGDNAEGLYKAYLYLKDFEDSEIH